MATALDTSCGLSSGSVSSATECMQSWHAGRFACTTGAAIFRTLYGVYAPAVTVKAILINGPFLLLVFPKGK